MKGTGRQGKWRTTVEGGWAVGEVPSDKYLRTDTEISNKWPYACVFRIDQSEVVCSCNTKAMACIIEAHRILPIVETDSNSTQDCLQGPHQRAPYPDLANKVAHRIRTQEQLESLEAGCGNP